MCTLLEKEQSALLFQLGTQLIETSSAFPDAEALPLDVIL
jgi:hypothetical protein